MATYIEDNYRDGYPKEHIGLDMFKREMYDAHIRQEHKPLQQIDSPNVVLEALYAPKHLFGFIVKAHCGFKQVDKDLFKNFILKNIEVFPIKFLY